MLILRLLDAVESDENLSITLYSRSGTSVHYKYFIHADFILGRILSERSHEFRITFPPFQGSDPGYALHTLTQPIKLRLQRCEGDDGKGVKEHSPAIILIEPLATLRAVDSFLWPRVQIPNESKSSEGTPAEDKGRE